jgi:hypothetical protein
MWASGPNAGKIAEDDQNKSVVVGNRLAFSYTGLAHIGSQKTDDWLLDVISGVRPFRLQDIVNRVATESTSMFRSLQISKDLKHHAFLGTGWARFARDAATDSAFLMTISNALDDQWQWKREPDDEFSIRGAVVGPDNPFLFKVVGQSLTSEEEISVRRRLASCVSHDAGPSAYIRVMADTAWRVASRNQAVGKNLMAVSIPFRALAGSGTLVVPIGVDFSPDEVVAAYLPASGDRTLLYAPHFAQESMVFKNISFRTERS